MESKECKIQNDSKSDTNYKTPPSKNLDHRPPPELIKLAEEQKNLPLVYDKERNVYYKKIKEFDFHLLDTPDPLTLDCTYSEIIQKLSKLSTPSICDAHSEVRLMDNTIHTYNTDPLTRLVGRAYTVHSAGDALSTMEALDDLPNFILSLGCSDDIVPFILIIASCGSNLAMAGGICAETAKLKGYKGIITDGNCESVHLTVSPH